MVNKTECDKLPSNNIVKNDIDVELSMTNTTYQQLETNQGGYKVVLEFPKQSENEESIKQEVKLILASVLQERLRKSS